MPDLSVVLPTYNEAGHIELLLQQVADACAGIDYEVLVVDDNSPDGTHAKVLEVQAQNARVVPVLRTTERGLATAVIEGIRRARGTYVVVMDSDFQHPPATIPKLLEAAQRESADFVVGSRYAQGGSVTGFPLSRRVISWGAKTISVLALPRVRQFKIKDPMSGFFLVRREIVEPEALQPRGYKILIEILARCNIRRAVEVGFAFETRRAGASKLRLKTQYDYFLHVIGLGLHDRENRRVVVFAFVGITGIVVNAALFELLKRTSWYEALASNVQASQAVLLLLPASVAREATILWNFWWNDTLTFRDLREHAHARFLVRVARFNIASILAWIAYLGVLYVLLSLGMGHLRAILISIFLTFLINYRANRRWTYARRPGTADG